MPDAFYRRKVSESLGITLGPQDSYGSGIVFTPKSDAGVNAIKEIFLSQAKQRGMKVIGWRPIETGNFYFSTACIPATSISLSHHFLMNF